MSSLRVERFGCFGKLPVSREFLVDQARELSQTGFDRWIGEGLGMARLRLGARFDATVDGFPPRRFLWRPPSSPRWLIGLLVPSVDAAGRRHPFAVFASLDGRRAGGCGPSAFLAEEGLREVLEDLLAAMREAPTANDVVDTVRRAEGGELTLPPGEPAYHGYLAETPLADFFHRALGAPDAPLRYQVLQAFVETLQPLAGRPPAEIRMGLRFPLGGPDSDRAHFEAAFWLDLAERRMGRPLDSATGFWSEAGADGRAGEVLLFFSEPSAPQWSCLVDRDVELETVSFLDRPYGHSPELRMEPALRRLLEAPEATLADLLAWAGRGKG